jgi:hypothetical protein
MALVDRATLSYNCGPKGKAGQGGTASTRGFVNRLTSANIVATDAAVGSWLTAAQALTNGQISRFSIDHGNNVGITPPTAPLNKGEKWIVTMQEVGGNAQIKTHTIPAADETGGHLLTGTLDWDPTNTDWVNYKAAVDALLVSPSGALSMIFATIMTRRR